MIPLLTHEHSSATHKELGANFIRVFILGLRDAHTSNTFRSLSFHSNSLYILPSPVSSQIVNQGFDTLWESHNKGKLFKDMTFPDPDPE